jgi:large subunit ribosomal protein L35
MPKTKTKSAAKKRFRVTPTGKVLYVQSGLRHNLEKKSGKRKRTQARPGELSSTNTRVVRRLLPGS